MPTYIQTLKKKDQPAPAAPAGDTVWLSIESASSFPSTEGAQSEPYEIDISRISSLDDYLNQRNYSLDTSFTPQYLGKGSYGTVEMYRVVSSSDVSSQAFVALKSEIAPSSTTITPASYREGKFGEMFKDCTHVISTQLVLHNGMPYVYSDYMNAGNLQAALTAKTPLAPQEKEDILRQLMIGLGEMHSRKLLHSDIAARNVLLHRGADGKLTAKFSDYGRSSYRNSEGTDIYQLKQHHEEHADSPIRAIPDGHVPARSASYSQVIDGTQSAWTDIHQFKVLMLEIFSNGKFPGGVDLKSEGIFNFIKNNGELGWIQQGIAIAGQSHLTPEKQFLLLYGCSDNANYTENVRANVDNFHQLKNAYIAGNMDEFRILANNFDSELWKKCQTAEEYTLTLPIKQNISTDNYGIATLGESSNIEAPSSESAATSKTEEKRSFSTTSRVPFFSHSTQSEEDKKTVAQEDTESSEKTQLHN